ncbi:ABC transporter substrate-binding protein [Paenibacillus mendelii]|uniref:ABC transporter substrate-binding protein n=1 Tax=Paenibacillus mendelii TaxID=206163 RepID=A0ABV6J8A3_9BACL|nr:extracellular solute-binding protein [Paenibacillus mendelii]MCQ6561336.1 extracellular solute-binding protein [Paenibacillus mendelii]
MKNKWVTLLFAAMVAISAFWFFSSDLEEASPSTDEGKNNLTAETDERAKKEWSITVQDTTASNSSLAEEGLDLQGEPLRIAQWWEMEGELTAEEVERQRRVEEKYHTRIQYVPVPLDQVQSRLITSSIAGQPVADIIMLEVNWAFPKLVEEGYLQELDGLIDLDDPRFSANPITMKHGKFKGKQYGITLPYAESNGLYYNKTLLQEAGAPDPYELQEKGEWTWSKFLTICKALKKKGTPCLADYPVENSTFFIYSNDGAVVENNKVAFDSPNAMEAIEFMRKLYADDDLIGEEGIVERNVAFAYGYRWDALGYSSNPAMKDEMGYVFFPKGPKAKDYIVPYQKMNLWFMPKGTKYAKAKWAAWSELYEMDMEKGYNVRLQKEKPNFKTEQNMQTLRKMFNKIKLVDYTSYIGFNELYEESVKEIMAGKQSPVTGMQRIKAQAQAAIDISLKK